MALDLTDLNTSITDFNNSLASAIQSRLYRGDDVNSDEAFALLVRNFHEKTMEAPGIYAGGDYTHDFTAGAVVLFPPGKPDIQGIPTLYLENVPERLTNAGSGNATFSVTLLVRAPIGGQPYPSNVVINNDENVVITWPGNVVPSGDNANQYEIVTIDLVLENVSGSLVTRAFGSIRTF